MKIKITISFFIVFGGLARFLIFPYPYARRLGNRNRYLAKHGHQPSRLPVTHFLVAGLGIEPNSRAYETRVLPFHFPARTFDMNALKVENPIASHNDVLLLNIVWRLRFNRLVAL